jgi:hypothetical protein
MEQRLDAAFLRPGLMERAAALGIVAVAIGTGILLAAWGISLLWRYTPPEIRIANPEVTIIQNGPLTVTPDKPFTIQPPETFIGGADAGKTAAGDVIKREVTVFSDVEHKPGNVMTGWNYRDGSGGIPVQQFCYYTTRNVDGSSTRIDIAANGIRSFSINAGLVPNLEGALTKCQWWKR